MARKKSGRRRTPSHHARGEDSTTMKRLRSVARGVVAQYPQFRAQERPVRIVFGISNTALLYPNGAVQVEEREGRLRMGILPSEVSEFAPAARKHLDKFFS